MENKNQGTGASIPVKEDKHLSIDRAINDLDTVIASAQSVLDKALGHPVSIAGDKPDYAQPTLNEFLENSGGSIRDKIETLHSQISQLENILF